MNVNLFIAKRYLFSRNTRNAVNFISLISLLGFAIGTLALIVILSVFNGFELVINQLYNSYDPDIKIVSTEGKFFSYSDSLNNIIKSNNNIVAFSYTIEENGLVRYDDRQTIANIKGVDDKYFVVSNLESQFTEGDTNTLRFGKYTIFGRGLAAKLGVDFNGIESCNIYMPDKNADPLGGMTGGFSEETMMPTHEFTIQQELDGKTVIIPLSVMQNLLRRENLYTALEIRLKNGADLEATVSALRDALGEGFKVKDRYEQHELLNRIMKSEKSISFILLTFVLLIVSFNLTAGLVMLVLEKRENIKTIKAMGGSDSLVRNIFLSQGMLICSIGTACGLVLGYILCQLQISYGFIPIGEGDTLVISSYPIALKFTDFIAVSLVALVTGFLCSYIPARKAGGLVVSDN